MLSEHEEILLLRAENEKLKSIIKYLDSKNSKYIEYMKELKIKIESKVIKDPTVLIDEYKYGINYSYITHERITMPDFIIGYRGRQQDLIKGINEILES